MTMYSNPMLIKGKWNGRSYEIQKELGRGANGIVYLAVYQNQAYALKVGQDTFSMTSEVNVLKQFGQAQGGILGPSIYDVDDWEVGSESRPFYVMNVIEGNAIPQFIQSRGREWVPVLILQLLGFLQELHKAGWIFGDLKPDNLKVSGTPPKLAWFDAGGMTKTGRSIKEYTELFDRGYWGLGNRKAEPSYDLFSVAMIFLHLHLGKLPQPAQDTRQQLQQLIFTDSSLFPYQSVIWKAIDGKYRTAREMKEELVHAWHYQKGGKLTQSEPSGYRRTKKKKRSFVGTAVSLFFFSSLTFFLFTLYLIAQG